MFTSQTSNSQTPNSQGPNSRLSDRLRNGEVGSRELGSWEFFWALTWRSFSRIVGLFAGLATVLAGLQVLIVLVATSQEQARSFDLIMRLAPAFVQRQFGSTLPTFLSFGGLVTFGYFHPVVVLMIAMFAAFVASELAADVEGGQVDLLLARPLARHWLVSRSLALVVICPVASVLVMMCSTWLALSAFAPDGARWPTVASTAAMAAHLVAIAWCFGTLGLAFSAIVRRRMSAAGPAAILAVSLYLVDLLAGSWQPIRVAGVISPFHYYQGAEVLAGTADSARDLLVLGSMSLALASLAYWRFNARDV